MTRIIWAAVLLAGAAVFAFTIHFSPETTAS